MKALKAIVRGLIAVGFGIWFVSIMVVVVPAFWVCQTANALYEWSRQP